MTIERVETISLAGLRQATHEWLTDRPTIRHTPLSLFSLVKGEARELMEAIARRKPLSEINMELGDVLFSTLALDDREGGDLEIKTLKRGDDNITLIGSEIGYIDKSKNESFSFKPSGPKMTKSGYSHIDTLYLFILEECNNRQIDVFDLFNKVLYKNKVNYPYTMFNEMTPFSNPNDAISALRIIRKAYNSDPENLDSHWADSDREIAELPFFDGWVATGMFRSFIKKTLQGISERGEVDTPVKTEIERLIGEGSWDMTPFIIPGNQYNWHIW